MKFEISSESDRKKLIKYINEMDVNKPKTVEIKPVRKKRTVNQNDLLWGWMDIIKKESQYDPKEVYKFFCQNFLPWIKREFWGVKVEIVGGSSKLSTIEFNEFTDKIKAFANEQDIYLPYPDELGWNEFCLRYIQ